MSFKNTILREALQLFEQNGIDSLSEAELKKRLDISEATFQGFFKDKADLLLQAYQQRLDDDKENHRKIAEAAPNAVEELLALIDYGSQQLVAISPAYINDITKYEAVMKLFADHVESYSYPQTYAILNKGVEQGFLRKEINLTVVTRIILECIYLLLNTRAFPPEAFSTREVFRNIYLYYIRGLCTREHIGITDQYFAS